ncbi:MAG: hypothetical protein A3A24_01985 [Candidatus Buchananbacteria bacterium RIFCSPLOWO2_01_FULL_46_12]|uniref:Nucleoside 2-deoxyribosyltransferase n=2 Tax=Candidatus Buchananiibacteriota TaxID=1817903 RepID=A0A1G1YSE7_9BACT|nr:MAG: hypothetical protein A2744_00105 [Candidatus Buchananbacteria bacterium RIFCSPHIGHO2_01_FULL_44_11]OGY55224.1 MAG: hypothetical protein A3A24_01985 [Candidatus Buchananbacteria bacterium RIFCSPLOWO2_01_FULL_46_12]
MRVYFAADSQAEQKFQERYSKIIDALNGAGVLVMSNLAQQNVSGFSGPDLEKINQSGEVMVEKMDALVIEGSRSLPESGYLIAIALAHGRPILFLTEKGTPANKNIAYLQKDKVTDKLLQIKSYTDSGLNQILVDFLALVEQGEGKEVPNIKFTLRITSRIERYLQWKTHNTKLSKADYLRNVIEDLIDADESYQNFIGRQEKK